MIMQSETHCTLAAFPAKCLTYSSIEVNGKIPQLIWNQKKTLDNYHIF